MSNQFKDFILTILIVTFVFAFDDKQTTFQINYWLLNFLRVGIGVSIVVLVHYLGHKIVAKHYGAQITHQFWSIKRFGFPKKAKFSNLKKGINSIPLGGILAVIITFLSNGKLFFFPVESIEVKAKEYKRLGRNKLKILEKEVARIAFAGPTANIFFAFILQSFNEYGGFNQIILTSCLYAVYSMIPWSQLDGAKIFFGSLNLYIFALSFVLLSFFLLMIIPPLAALLISIIGAIIIIGLFFIKRHT